MKILVNALVTPPETVGVGNYILQLVRYLSEARSDIEVVVLCDQDFSKLLPSDNPKITTVITGFHYHPRWKSLIYSILWQRIQLPKIILKYKIDLYLLPNTSWLPSLSIPIVSTVHDLLEVDTRVYSLIKRIYRKWLLHRISSKSARIVTVTQFSAGRIRNYLGSDIPISVISPFIKYEVASDSKKTRPQDSQGRFSILYIGNERPYKGAACILKAYSTLATSNPNVELVLCGPFSNKFINEHISDEKIRKRVRLTGFITEDKLDELYRSASVYVSGSEYEGFGLPVLEAMSFRLPVILPNIPVFKEIAGEAALFYSSGVSKDLLRILTSIIENIDLQKEFSEKSELQRKMFDNRKKAQQLLSVLDEVTTTKGHS